MTALVYATQGKGQVVLLLHGFCENNTLWQNYMKHLAKRYRVIALDLPGFGASEDLLNHPTTLTQIAEQINEFLQTLEIEKAIFIGHSLGGYVSLAFAEKYPEKVQGIGLFHSTALPDSDEKKKNRDNLIKIVNKKGTAEFMRNFVDDLFYDPRKPDLKDEMQLMEYMVTQTAPKTIITLSEAMRDRPDRTQVLKKAKFPVLFIIGRDDKFISYASYQSQIDLPAHSLVHILPETGHIGMLERPQTCLKAIEAFLEICLVQNEITM
ncbi:MAG: alpha/beta hydrolase [Cytophagales bacterium]|nr:MAG: alpha/beta hydrolase [Cytophagales bacterium]